MRADLHIRLRRGRDGAVAALGTLARPPWWCRWDGETLWLVGSAATPVGDDDIGLSLDVGAGVHATVRSVAATVVYAASGDGTLSRVRVEVAEDASLHWHTEPVIVTERARHRAVATLAVAAGSSLRFDETVVFGRHEETAGTMQSSTELIIDDRTVSLTSWDSALPGWSGPGGIDGAASLTTTVAAGPAVDEVALPESSAPSRHSAVLRPERGGLIVTSLFCPASEGRTTL